MSRKAKTAKRIPPRSSGQARSRAASVLILTLIVIALLTLGAMSFFERMYAEHSAVRAHGRQLQARQFAESGIDYIRTILTQDPITIDDSGGLFLNPGLFQGVRVVDDPLGAFRGQFTVVSPNISSDGLYGGIRYGLENESSRLNLNTVLLADKTMENGARTLLLRLPGMTESIADAILDWIDEDDEPRMLGAERDYYSALPIPYAPRNGSLASIEELLLVRDVTPALLFGPDLNRNSAIDATEQSLTSIDNADNSVGLLNRGWSAYLTLDSAELNLRPDSRPKIDVNKDDLEELHKELSEVLGGEMANFIVAYRQGGRYDGDESGQAASSVTIDFKQPGRERLNTVLDLIGVKTRISRTNETDGGNSDGGEGSGGGRGQGGGGGGGSGNRNSRIVINAAFADDPGSMKGYLAKLMENVAVNSERTIPGRLNINQASRQIMLGIPGLDSTIVDQIISQRDFTLGQQQPDQTHETWLLTQGIVDLPKMKQLMPLLTSGGNVYRAQIVGGYFTSGPTERVEVVIDATKAEPFVRRRIELRSQGPGYTPEALGAQFDDIP